VILSLKVGLLPKSNQKRLVNILQSGRLKIKNNQQKKRLQVSKAEFAIISQHQ
jgi:hypothetical protein